MNGREADSRVALTEHNLGLVAELLSQPQHQTEWLSLNPSRYELLAETSACVKRMADNTKWTMETLLRQLGCRTEAVHEVRSMPREEVQRCLAYFQWVEELIDLVDRPLERQRVVAGAARTFRELRGDLAACRGAMIVGDFPAIEFLRLGEIDRGWAACRSRLDLSTDADSSESPEGDSDGPRPHLRSKRIDRFLDGDDESIGPAMRKRIAVHIAECDLCERAVAERSERREAHASPPHGTTAPKQRR